MITKTTCCSTEADFCSSSQIYLATFIVLKLMTRHPGSSTTSKQSVQKSVEQEDEIRHKLLALTEDLRMCNTHTPPTGVGICMCWWSNKQIYIYKHHPLVER